MAHGLCHEIFEILTTYSDYPIAKFESNHQFKSCSAK